MNAAPEPTADPGATASGPAADGAGSTDTEPILTVVSGRPSTDEVAALVTVLLAARSAGHEEPPSSPRSEWGAHARKLRGVHRHSPGAWRASAWPR